MHRLRFSRFAVRGLAAALFCVLPTQVSAQATWRTGASMPTGVFNALGVMIKNRIYVVGGGGPNANSGGLLQIFDSKKNVWDDSKTPLPTARAYVGGGAIKNLLLVVGGCINADCGGATVTNLLHVYNLKTNAWQALMPAPTNRYGMASGVHANRLFIAGGEQASPPGFPQLGTLEIYDHTKDTWSAGADMPTPRVGAGGAFIGNLFYVAGVQSRPGLGDPYVHLNTLEAYDRNTNSWTTLAPMPTARSYPQVVAIGGKLYVIGGTVAAGVVTDVVEVYDPTTNTWANGTAMPTARSGPAGGFAKGELHVTGGINGGILDTVESAKPNKL